MTGRIIEITTPGRSLHLDRGFLTIRENGKSVGRVPLDDIDAVIAATPGLYWSGNLLSALAQRSVAIVLIGQNFAPIAHILPLAAHHNQGNFMQAQAECSMPVKKRLWAQLIKAKIEAQAHVLSLAGQANERLNHLKTEVKSGDTTNREAAAAQYYWRHLMGHEFRRNRAEIGANALLNYGYTILRAATARAIVASGLNPSLSLHHASNGEALRLADDLMEPFRPTIDLTVYDLVKSGTTQLTPEVKAKLVAVLEVDFIMKNGHTPLSHALVRLAQSLAGVYLKEQTGLALPSPMRPVLDQLALGPHG